MNPTTAITIPSTALELRSLVQADSSLQIHLESVPVPAPGPDEVLVQVQATPINPSDMGCCLDWPTCPPCKSVAAPSGRWSKPASPNAPCTA